MTLTIAPPISQSQERAQSSRLAFFVASWKFASFDSDGGKDSVRSSRAKDGWDWGIWAYCCGFRQALVELSMQWSCLDGPFDPLLMLVVLGE